MQKRYRMSTCHKPKPHKTKIQMHTKAAKLTAKSSFAEVQEAIADVKEHIEWWHNQDTDPIEGDWTKDWCGCRYLLIMRDGSFRTAIGSIDEAMSGDMMSWLDYFDGKDIGDSVDQSQIKMWLRLADNDRYDVEFDGKQIGG